MTHPYQDPIEDAELRDPPGGRTLRLRFRGPFEGREVVWDATLRATGSKGNNYIEIGKDGADGIPLEVGLALEQIDLPAVRKAIMMIHRYKRLHRGRHDYGGPYR